MRSFIIALLPIIIVFTVQSQTFTKVDTIALINEYQNRSRSFIQDRKYTEAEELLKSASILTSRVNDTEESLESLLLSAELNLLKGNLKESLKDIDTGVALSEKHTHFDFLGEFFLLKSHRSFFSDHDDQLLILHKSLDAFEKGSNLMQWKNVAIKIGDIYTSQGEFEKAQDYFLSANQINEIEPIQKETLTNINEDLKQSFEKELTLEELETEKIKGEGLKKWIVRLIPVLAMLLLFSTFLFKTAKTSNHRAKISKKEAESSRQKANEASKRAEQSEKEVQEAELHRRETEHRLKENIGQTQIFLQQMKVELQRDEKALQKLEKHEAKIHSMLVISKMILKKGNDEQLPLKEFLEKMAQHFIEKYELTSEQIETNADLSIILPSKKLASIGAITNEFISNSIKYASVLKLLKIQIKSTVLTKEMLITYTDNGKGYNGTVTSEGHGLELMRLFAKSMNGTIEFKTENGAKAILKLTQ